MTAPPAASCLTIARDDGVLRLTKTNPKSGYGISIAMWQALTAAFEGARVDPSVRAIVIDAGGRGFHRGAVMVTELQAELAKLGNADFRNLVQMGHSDSADERAWHSRRAINTSSSVESLGFCV
jgi:enoyl-CoA hydratase/carnithine racemase